MTRRQYRGAEVFAANLSIELIRQGQQIVFAGLYEPPEDALTIPGAVHADMRASKNVFISYGAVKRLSKLIQEEQPDIIQANGSDTLKYALAARLLSGNRPVIYRNISIISKWVGNSFLKKKLYSWLFKRVDHVSSVGHEAREDFKRFFSFPDQKISVIRRGIPLNAFDREKARAELLRLFDFPVEVKIFVHVGNFSEEKNHKFLLEVFALVKKKNEKARLLLVGEGTEYKAIADAVVQLGLQHTVYLLGFRRDIENIVPAADAFVMGSLIEGVPGVILEAASYNVPSVAVKVGGVPEVVRHNETGILLAHHDAADFANALLLLLSDENKRLQLGANAYRYVVDEFNPAVNAQKFIELYQTLNHG